MELITPLFAGGGSQHFHGLRNEEIEMRTMNGRVAAGVAFLFALLCSGLESARAQNPFDLLESAGGVLVDIGKGAASTSVEIGSGVLDFTLAAGEEVVYIAGDASEFAYANHPIGRVGRGIGVLPQGGLGLLPSHPNESFLFLPRNLGLLAFQERYGVDARPQMYLSECALNPSLEASRLGRTRPEGGYSLTASKQLHSELTADQWLELGRRHFHAREYHYATQAMGHSIAKDPNDPICWYYLALSQQRLGNRKQAKALAKHAAQLELEHPRSQVSVRLQRVQGATRVWLEQFRRNAGVGPYTPR